MDLFLTLSVGIPGWTSGMARNSVNLTRKRRFYPDLPCSGAIGSVPPVVFYKNPHLNFFRNDILGIAIKSQETEFPLYWLGLAGSRHGHTSVTFG